MYSSTNDIKSHCRYTLFIPTFIGGRVRSEVTCAPPGSSADFFPPDIWNCKIFLLKTCWTWATNTCKGEYKGEFNLFNLALMVVREGVEVEVQGGGWAVSHFIFIAFEADPRLEPIPPTSDRWSTNLVWKKPTRGEPSCTQVTFKAVRSWATKLAWRPQNFCFVTFIWTSSRFVLFCGQLDFIVVWSYVHISTFHPQIFPLSNLTSARATLADSAIRSHGSTHTFFLLQNQKYFWKSKLVTF